MSCPACASTAGLSAIFRRQRTLECASRTPGRPPLLPSRGARRTAISFTTRRPQIRCTGSAGPGGGGRAGRRTEGSAADMRLIDFAERRIAPDEIKAAGYDGVVNYVSAVAPRRELRGKADHPRVRGRAARGGPADRQQLPVRQTGLARPVGFHPRARRRRGRRSDGPATAQCGRGHGFGPDLLQRRRQHRREHLERPCGANGFGESTRYWAWGAPASMGMPRRAGGRSETA